MLEASEPKTQNQFGLSTILVLTTAIALLLAYARSLGDSSATGNAVTHLMVYLLMATAAAVVCMLISRDLHDSVYWPVLTSVLVFLAVAGGRLPSESVVYGWGLLAALCGGLGALQWPGSIVLGSLCSGVVGGLSILGAILWFQEPVKGLVLFDIACGVVVGAILRPAIIGLKTFVRLSGHPPIAMAAWMSLIVLAGNFLVPIVAGVQR